MATHSSILAWNIPRTEEPGGLLVHGIAKSWTWLSTQHNEIPLKCSCSGAKLCLTLSDPMDYSPSGSSVHGIFQARILEQIAISYSRGSPRPDSGIESASLESPALAGGFITTSATWEAQITRTIYMSKCMDTIQKSKLKKEQVIES